MQQKVTVTAAQINVELLLHKQTELYCYTK
jgi:hypothetical protein